MDQINQRQVAVILKYMQGRTPAAYGTEILSLQRAIEGKFSKFQDTHYHRLGGRANKATLQAMQDGLRAQLAAEDAAWEADED